MRERKSETRDETTDKNTEKQENTKTDLRRGVATVADT